VMAAHHGVWGCSAGPGIQVAELAPAHYASGIGAGVGIAGELVSA